MFRSVDGDPIRHMRWRVIIDCFLLFWVAALAAGLGMSLPVHFRAVSPLVLEEAGRSTDRPADLQSDLLAAGRVGAAAVVGEVGLDGPFQENFRHRRVQILESHPAYRLSGGPAPFFEQFLRLLDFGEEFPESAVIPFLVPRSRRAELEGFLALSSNEGVQVLLRTREITAYTRFLPVFSEAGHPLDATILTAAMLEQSGRWSPSVSRRLRLVADAALRGEADALEDLEQFFLGVFTLGKRLDWGALSELTPRFQDVGEIYGFGALVHGDEGGTHLPALYTATLLAGSPADWVDYLRTQGTAGWRALVYALPKGAGALEALLSLDKPLYTPSPIFRVVEPFTLAGAERFQGIAQRQPRLTFGLKLFAFFTAGFSLALIINRVGEALHRRPPASYRNPLFLAANTAAAFLFALLLWAVIEPELLQFEENRESILRIDLASIAAPLTQTPSSSSDMIDQVTILILLLFFVLQLAVFVFCLIRIGEVKKQNVAPETKIRLLENEEHLFDLGLYVGLGGTVSALILVVLNVVEASLMAAYASTLFGIIFVALLKVMVLRPYRRRLILQASGPAPRVPTSLLS